MTEEAQGNLKICKYKFDDDYRKKISAHIVDRFFRFNIDLNNCLDWGDSRFCTHYRGIIEGLQEIYRVLKDGGVFYNAVLTKENLDKLFYTKNGFKKFDKHEYSEMGQKVGFKKLSFKDLGDYGLLIIYEKE